ncbi:MAG: MerR family transcriptional regulator [Firmicutes bacterium]|nr:MerR family transcriptional regulator [Bacillota bacterium]
MKTGQFAEKYNLTPNGIRYYIEQGLLNPGKRGQQYDFDEECIRRMEEIQRLKQMHYSLDEISRIFHVKELSQHTLNERARQDYNQLFQNKILQLQNEIRGLEESIRILENAILPAPAQNMQYGTGIPIGLLPILSCPDCGGEFDFKDTDIRRGRLSSGKGRCSCGYELEIRDGILICRSSGDFPPMHIEWSDLPNLLSECSVDYLNLEANAYYRLKNLLLDGFADENGQIKGTIITSGGYAGNFICKYHKLFHPDTTFIIADQSLEVLHFIRDKLGVLNDAFEIIYICSPDFDLPLRDASVDLFLDDYSSSEFIFYNPKYPLELMRRVLKAKSICTGVFTYYQRSAKSLETIQKDYPRAEIPLFCSDTFRRHLISSGVDLVTADEVGSTENPGGGLAFDYHCPGDSLSFLLYCGVVK